MSATETKTVHKFEEAGLGLAPFRYVGMEYQEIRYGNRVVMMRGANGAVIECETKPGGTCDYCGTYIVDMFRVESADGKRFKVGCDCIRKVGDAGLVKIVDEAKKLADRDKRVARKVEKARVDRLECETAIIEKAAVLASLPHPNPYHASTGKTLADYATWMMANHYCERLAVMLRKI